MLRPSLADIDKLLSNRLPVSFTYRFVRAAGRMRTTAMNAGGWPGADQVLVKCRLPRREVSATSLVRFATDELLQT